MSDKDKPTTSASTRERRPRPRVNDTSKARAKDGGGAVLSRLNDPAPAPAPGEKTDGRNAGKRDGTVLSSLNDDNGDRAQPGEDDAEEDAGDKDGEKDGDGESREAPESDADTTSTTTVEGLEALVHDRIAAGLQAAAERVRSADLGRVVGDVERNARRHPVIFASAAALVGLGLAWLAASATGRRAPRPWRSGNGFADRAEAALAGSLEDWGHRVSENAGALKAWLTAGTEDMNAQAREQVEAARRGALEAQVAAEKAARKARARLGDAAEDNPLLLTGLAFALGAAAGALLPGPRRARVEPDPSDTGES